VQCSHPVCIGGLPVENYSKIGNLSLQKRLVMQETWTQMTAYSAGLVVTQDVFANKKTGRHPTNNGWFVKK